MSQSKSDRDAAIKKIKDQVCDTFRSDGLRPEEVVLRDDGKIVVDRRARDSRNVPFVVGEWN